MDVSYLGFTLTTVAISLVFSIPFLLNETSDKRRLKVLGAGFLIGLALSAAVIVAGLFS